MDGLEAAEIAVSHVDMSRGEIGKTSHTGILEGFLVWNPGLGSQLVFNIPGNGS